MSNVIYPIEFLYIRTSDEVLAEEAEDCMEAAWEQRRRADLRLNSSNWRVRLKEALRRDCKKLEADIRAEFGDDGDAA